MAIIKVKSTGGKVLYVLKIERPIINDGKVDKVPLLNKGELSKKLVKQKKVN
jgi:hypothetical protein